MLKAVQSPNFTPKTMKWLLVLVTIFLSVLTAAGILSYIYNKIHRFDFFPGVTVAGRSLKNLTIAQAAATLQQQADGFVQQGLIYKFREEEIKLPLIMPAAADPDLSFPLVDYKVAETVGQAYRLGRSPDYLQSFYIQLKALIFGIDVPSAYNFRQDAFLEIWQNRFAGYVTPKAEARPQIDENFNITIQPERTGANFDYPYILKATAGQLNKMTAAPITIELIEERPQVNQADIGPKLIQELADLVATSSIRLVIRIKHGRWKIRFLRTG